MFTQDSNTNILTSKCVKNTLIAVGALLSLYLLTEAYYSMKSAYYLNHPSFSSSINVSGKSEVNLKPDIATFNFTVSEESSAVSSSQTVVDKKVASILDALKKSGVEERDIKTLAYSISPRYEYAGQYYGTGKRSLAAYTVTQTVEVKSRNIAEAGKLLVVVGNLGATDVSGLSFDVENRDEIVRNARAEAIKDAKKEAARLAKDLGIKLGEIQNFSEGGYYPISPMYYSRAMDASGAAMETKAAEIPAGETKIVSNVTLTYEIR